jgi:ubiquinone/menaquinone biosynthesis C-methylase UbiE
MENDKKILTNPYITGTYLPSDPTGRYHLVLKPAKRTPVDISDLPVPPRELWEGYGQDADAYLASGRRHMAIMQEILSKAGFAAENPGTVLDFGCAAGRMLRFYPDAGNQKELWGVDINARYIGWCQDHLPPPFHFATVTTLPHLPFEDRYFDLVYCGSVFTHTPPDLADTWLLELRRVLREGGLAYVTIQDKTSMQMLLARHDGAVISGAAPDWEKLDGEPGTSSAGIHWIAKFDETIDLGALDYACFSFSESGALNVFYDAEHIAERWSRLFEFVSLTPKAYGNQTVLLLRKRTR